MNKEHLFAFLKDHDSSALLKLLETAYDEMNAGQRNAVFGMVLKNTEPLRKKGLPQLGEGQPLPARVQALLKEVKYFRRDSLARKYYASFSINSKNFMHVPEATNAWFERLGKLLDESARLSQQGDHVQAVACFRILYELIEAMTRGEEIVFADEYGTWMIPTDGKKIVRAYFASLAATSTPEEYAAAALPLIRWDSMESFADRCYDAAVRAGNKNQKACLKAEVERRRIRTGPDK